MSQILALIDLRWSWWIAGVALAAAMDEEEKAAAVARIEAELAHATRQRDRALATYQQSRATVGRVMEGVM